MLNPDLDYPLPVSAAQLASAEVLRESHRPPVVRSQKTFGSLMMVAKLNLHPVFVAVNSEQAARHTTEFYSPGYASGSPIKYERYLAPKSWVPKIESCGMIPVETAYAVSLSKKRSSTRIGKEPPVDLDVLEGNKNYILLAQFLSRRDVLFASLCYDQKAVEMLSDVLREHAAESEWRWVRYVDPNKIPLGIGIELSSDTLRKKQLRVADREPTAREVTIIHRPAQVTYIVCLSLPAYQRLRNKEAPHSTITWQVRRKVVPETPLADALMAAMSAPSLP